MSCVCALFWNLLGFLYQVAQLFLNVLFAPQPPAKDAPVMGHVAVIGAGVTGVAAAANLKAHGFSVTIFEKRPDLGGVWCDVNATSNLQTNSVLYRFTPLAFYRSMYPFRDEILAQQRKVWDTYQLGEHARFNTPVTKVERYVDSDASDGPSRWIINGNKSEVFDGLVVALGTCGDPNMIRLPKEKSFRGKIVHSSQLDAHDFRDKRVVVIGGGASGVEAAETAIEKGAQTATILARSDRWIISRYLTVNVILSFFPYYFERLARLIPERLVRRLHYRDLDEKMSPTKPLYSDTPVVNNDFMRLVRQGKADYQRGEVTQVRADGVEYNFRRRDQPKGESGEKRFMHADYIVLASGFKHPSLSFLPDDVFPHDYKPPYLYLQCIPVTEPTITCPNTVYVNGFGSVGHVHVGMYVRLLILFLYRPETRPTPQMMRLWVDLVRWVKRDTTGGALEFFCYPEMMVWFIACLMLNVRRIAYAPFVLSGLGQWKVVKGQQVVYRYTITDVVSRLVNQLRRIPLERPTFTLSNSSSHTLS